MPYRYPKLPFAIFLCLALFSTVLNAQDADKSYFGVVLDLDNQPVSDAMVGLDESEMVLSDQKGKFTVTLPADHAFPKDPKVEKKCYVTRKWQYSEEIGLIRIFVEKICNEVRGIVKDQAGRPMPGADVAIINFRPIKRKIADQRGEFDFLFPLDAPISTKLKFEVNEQRVSDGNLLIDEKAKFITVNFISPNSKDVAASNIGNSQPENLPKPNNDAANMKGDEPNFVDQGSDLSDDFRELIAAVEDIYRRTDEQTIKFQEDEEWFGVELALLEQKINQPGLISEEERKELEKSLAELKDRILKNRERILVAKDQTKASIDKILKIEIANNKDQNHKNDYENTTTTEASEKESSSSVVVSIVLGLLLIASIIVNIFYYVNLNKQKEQIAHLVNKIAKIKEKQRED